MGLFLDYNANVPNGPDDPADDQPEMLTNTQSINTWTNVDHVGYNVINAGIHKQVRMRNQSAPGLGDGEGVLYAKLINGNSWPAWQNALGSFNLMQFAPLAANNGYIILPGSIVVEWGRLTGLSGAWPTTDQTLNLSGAITLSSLFSVYTTFIGPTSSSTGDICINQVNPTNFHWQFTGSALSSFDGFFWLAIGA
jgi:hypothetical protein